MDTNELKKLVAKHFDYSTPEKGAYNNGQFLHGEWFMPKHKDALGDLLDELETAHEEAASDLRSKIDSLEEDLESKDETIKELQAEKEGEV